jgi:hypothetical protein
LEAFIAVFPTTNIKQNAGTAIAISSCLTVAQSYELQTFFLRRERRLFSGIGSYKRNSYKNVEDFDPIDLGGLSVVSSYAELVPARHFFYVKFHRAIHSRSSSIRVRLLVSPGEANRKPL